MKDPAARLMQGDESPPFAPPMPYRRSISTLGCPDYSLEETLALAQRHALAAVELRALADTIDLPTVLAAAYGTPTALAARMKSAPVPIVSLDTSLKLAVNSPADRADFLKFLPWAEAVGVPWLRVFDGGHAADPATHRSMADTVAWWRAEKKTHGWRAESSSISAPTCRSGSGTCTTTCNACRTMRRCFRTGSPAFSTPTFRM